MKTLLPQGSSRSLLSLTTCGYLPYSRQNSLNLATHRSQGCPGKLGSPLFQGDGRKSRSADCRERSTRREDPRGGLAPLPWSCEVSIDLVNAAETLGQDRIHIISITARHTALDWSRREHGRVVFLRGKSRSKCDCPRDRGNYPAFIATNNTRIEPRQRRRRAESAAYTAGAACAVTHSRELQSAIRLRGQTASTCLTLVTPARLPTIGESRDQPIAPTGQTRFGLLLGHLPSARRNKRDLPPPPMVRSCHR
jgi:hypothetical protein